VHVPLDATEDREFWNVWAAGPQFGTPLYYGPHLERFPERSAAVLNAIARAERLPARYAARGEEDQRRLLEAFLADKGTSAREVITALLAGLDVEARLAGTGLTRSNVSALRRRLLDP
jgi:protein-tyrosine phosphatase